MFCSKCGRQINNDAIFCTFCGSPTLLAAPPVPAPQSIPLSSEGFAANAFPTAQSVPTGGTALGAPASVPFENENTAGSLPVPEEPSLPADNAPAENASPEAETGASVPLFGQGAPEPSYADMTAPPRSVPFETAQSRPAAPVFEQRVPAPELAAADTGAVIDFSAPIPPAATSEEETHVKYYTFGHIALCLAAVGVMAIVAGIFAGLYFSVI